jgi:hypothetical protein
LINEYDFSEVNKLLKMKLPKVTYHFFKPSIPSCSNNYKICIFFFSIIEGRRYSLNPSSNYIISYFSFKTFCFCLIYNLAKLFLCFIFRFLELFWWNHTKNNRRTPISYFWMGELIKNKIGIIFYGYSRCPVLVVK